MWRLLLTAILVLSLAANWYLYGELQSQQNAIPQQNLEPQKLGDSKSTDSGERSSKPYPLSAIRLQQSREETLSQQTSSSPDWLTLAREYFANHQFDDAVDALFQLQEESDLNGQQLLLDWQSQTSNWISGGQIELAQQFLASFLHQQPYNTQMLELEAFRLTYIQEYQDAIRVYYNIIDNSYDPETQARMLEKIHRVVEKYLAQMRKEHHWQQIVDLMESLIYHEPDHLPYQFILATALAELERFDQARQHLWVLEEFDVYSAKARLLLSKIDNKETGNEAIHLTRKGEHYLVTGDLAGGNRVNLMIDTGASISVLSQRHFDRIKQSAAPTRIRGLRINTAGGQVRAIAYRFASLDIGGYVVKDIAFAVLDLDDLDGADGLLGMNYLRKFTFQIDQDNSQLLLAHR